MGVADTDPGKGQTATADANGALDQLCDFQGAWQGGRLKAGASHLDCRVSRSAVAVEMQLDVDEAAAGLYREAGPSRAPCRVQIATENAQAIARLLRFTAVRVVDAHPEVGLAGRVQRQNAVAPQAPIAIAEGADYTRRQTEVQLSRIYGYIVVAETVTLEESVSHF